MKKAVFLSIITMSIFSGLFGKKEDPVVFKFTSPENEACFTCKHVLDEKKPILYVSHDEDDGGWQFLCGADIHEETDAKIVSLLEIVKIDPSVNALHEMPEGVCAIRETKDSDWKFYKN
ncbi:MAG: DUF2185 domain-containing protein [Verrucomicrobiota bacterium JB023]|nr:DUF2185 domain-containing protein [Verrucomicrobiota bacterium JB023]